MRFKINKRKQIFIREFIGGLIMWQYYRSKEFKKYN